MVGPRNFRHRKKHRVVDLKFTIGTYSCLRMARRKQVCSKRGPPAGEGGLCQTIHGCWDKLVSLNLTLTFMKNFAIRDMMKCIFYEDIWQCGQYCGLIEFGA